MTKTRTPYILLLPSTILFLLFVVWPIISVGRLSLQNTNFINSSFAGIANYIKLFTDPAFRQAILNTFIFAAFLIPFQIVVPLTIALMAYNTTTKEQTMLRTMFYIPSLASAIVISSVWKWIFEYRKGLANWILGLVGIDRIQWFGQQLPAIFVITLTINLMSLGGILILYMAVMMGISREMIDTAICDGASWSQIRRYIMIPIISPTILFLGLLAMIGSFQIWENIYVFTSGGPAGKTASMVYYIYETGFIKSQYGYASAGSIVLMVIILGLAMIKKRLEPAEEKYE